MFDNFFPLQEDASANFRISTATKVVAKENDTQISKIDWLSQRVGPKASSPMGSSSLMDSLVWDILR